MTRTPNTPLHRLSLGVAAVLLSMASFSASAVENGPAPTRAFLMAAAGNYQTDFVQIDKANAKGYGGATIYFPKGDKQAYGLVTLTPGFFGPSAVYGWLAERIASYGFVVVGLDTNTVLDQPPARATQMAAALKQAIELSQNSSSPLFGLVDTSRRAVVGHSMGGGGTLLAATADPTLKAAVGLQPWSLLTKNFPTLKVPSLIVSAQNDTIAPNSGHSDRFYASLSTTLPRGQVVLAGANHFSSTLLSTAGQDPLAASTVSWLKLFLDGDTRYTELVKTGLNGAEYKSYKVTGF